MHISDTTSTYTPNIIAFDSNLLSAYYNTKIQQATLSTSTSVTALNAGSSGSDIVPPWDSSNEQPTFDERLRKALAASNFVNLKAANLGGDNVSADYRALFALHTGLNLLSAIASEAADKTTSGLLLTGYDRQFQEGLTQVFDFLNAFTPTDFILAAGAQADKVSANISIPRVSSEYSSGILHTGAAGDAIPGLTGTEVFNVAVTKSGATTNVSIDLANVSGTLNITNISDYINTQLTAGGFSTRFSRETLKIQPTVNDGTTLAADRAPITGYGFKIAGLSTEVVEFSAATATGAVYIVGNSGDADHEGGQILKLTGIESGNPTQESGTRIAPESGSLRVGGSTMDSQGNTYMVGTTTGDLDNLLVGTKSDVFLSKYDSAGNMIWQRVLGAAVSADGFAVEVDSSDNVIIAGSITGELTDIARGGGTDSFVTKYDSDGQEIFTRQIAPSADDQAFALTVASDGSIYIGGETDSALAAGLTYAGGADAYITKLSSAGVLVYNRQFGTTGDDRVTSIAIAADGDVIVGLEENGNGVVRKYAAADGTSASIWEVNLGSLGAGSLNAITVDGNNVYIAGSTDNATLNAGGTATVNGSLQGAQDGFFARVVDAGSSATADHVTYMGTGSTDRIYDVKISGGSAYLAGDTLGSLNGETLSGTIDGFAAKISTDGVTIDWTHQYRGFGGYGAGIGIEVDQAGASVLDTLGLPVGKIDYSSSNTVTAQTAVRAGQYFSISVDGGTARRISIGASDTLRAVALKIQNVLLLDGTAQSRRTTDGNTIRIEGNKGVRIDLIPGNGEDDALRGLGLEPGTIYNDGSILDSNNLDANGNELTPFYGLGLPFDLSLLTRNSAAAAAETLQDVMSELRKAFNDLTRDKSLDDLFKNGKGSGPVPAYLQAQLANYTAGLNRLESGGSSTLGFI